MNIVIIGGGLSGLSIGALLSHDGHTVTILEKNAQFGGRARVLQKKGFTFDMGPSWYLMPEVFEHYFSLFGKKSSQLLKLTRLTNKYKVYFEKHTPVIVDDSQKALMAFFESLEPGSSKVLLDLQERTQKAYKLAVQLLYRPLNRVRDFLSLKLIWSGLKLLALYNPFQSYHSFIKKHIAHSALQQLLEFHTVFLGGSPSNTPALYAILVAADVHGGTWYPQGGFGTLVDALISLNKDGKAHLRTNAQVDRLVIKGDVITGVVLSSGETISADLVVNASDYAHFDQHVVPATHREYSREYWQEKTMGISSLLLYLGVDKKLPDLLHHNFYFQENWDSHFDTIFKHQSLPLEPCFYLSKTSATDPSTAPKGMENLFVLVPVGVDSPEATSDEYVSHVIGHIEKTMGVELANHLVVKEVYGQKNFASDYFAYKGAALGLAHTLDQSIIMRPKHRSSKLHNLYHTGQYTQPGVGVPMVIISAELVFNQIKNDQNL